MKKVLLWSALILVMVLITMFVIYNTSEDEEAEKQVEVAQEGDFIFILLSDKKKYERGEKISFEATITYNGEQEELALSQAPNMLYYEVTNDNNELVAPIFAPTSMGTGSTIKKGETRSLSPLEIDTSGISDDQVIVDAKVDFSTGGKDYEIENEIVFTIEQ